jgi:hypothetical protein
MTRLSLTTMAVTMVAGLSLGRTAATAGCTNMDDPQAVNVWAEELRAEGPAGLAEVLRQCDELAKVVETYAKVQANPKHRGMGDPAEQVKKQLAQLQAVADLAAGQRGASVSRLYWYTDLAAAREAAAESGKPILSLRMLGKLTDEYSCANSRFFRTALYSNKEVSDCLREHYVLHWQSVRPVPRVTIDFGDGRKLERTVTGNSAHYVLDAGGRPLDVLPGLYGPRPFLDWLKQWEIKSRELAETDPQSQDEMLVYYHTSSLGALEDDLRRDLAMAAPEALREQLVSLGREGEIAELFPDAALAGSRAVTKTAGESPIVREVLPDDRKLVVENDGTWQKIAALHRDEAVLDAASVEVMRQERPTAFAAGALATSKRIVEDPILRLVRSFEEAIALDTVKNEYQLHRRVHEWYVAGEAPADFDALNERVYAELFLTPSSDPWLGLAPAEAYTALNAGGLTAAE